jgi:hypothetical protein
MSTVAPRQSLDLWRLKFVFPDPDATPLSLRERYENAIVLRQLPRQFRPIPGYTIECDDIEWVVADVIAVAKAIDSRKKSIVPLIILELKS